MKRLCSLFLIAVLFGCTLRAQVITITFESTLNGATIPLDSILVMNLTSGGDTLIYFPDNVLVLGSTGIGEALYTDGKMHALPNPFASSTEVAVESLGGAARIALHDVAGRELVSLWRTYRLVCNASGSAVRGRAYTCSAWCRVESGIRCA